MFLEVAADLGRQKDTSSGTEFTILLVQFALKNQFFEVDESHGHRGFLIAAPVLRQLPYLPLQAVGGELGRKGETGEGKGDEGNI